MKKRMLSLLLAATMLLTAMPFSAWSVSAAGSPVVNIPGTTGTGLSSADPLVVDTFAELKAAMEFDGEAYVRLTSGSGLGETLPAASSSSQNAITMVGTKHLYLSGFGTYNTTGDTKYNAFMLVNGQLTLSGDGGITYKHNSRYGDGAALLMTDADASLTIRDTVSITGELNDREYGSDSWAFARAIVATGGKLTVDGGTFHGRVYDGPGVQSYQHRSAMYLGRSVQAVVNGGEFLCSRSYNSSSPMDSHPVGITLAPNSPTNIKLYGGTYRGMYITGMEKALNAYLPKGCYYYDLGAEERFVGDTKESPYDDYENTSDSYHRITVLDVREDVLNFGVLTPTPTAAEQEAGVTDLGDLQIDTAQIGKTFSATAARLPDRELQAGFTTKLTTEVTKNGNTVYYAENGNAISLKTYVDGIGNYEVRYTLTMWDVLTDTELWSTEHVYTMTVINKPAAVVLDRIAITTPPAKTAYKEGDTLSLDGMVVTGYFSSGLTRELTQGAEYTLVESSRVQEGQTYFTVQVTMGNVTKTATCPITVTAANYAFTFLEEAPLTFDLAVGATPTAKSLTVQNIGDQRLTAPSTITLSGANPEAFVLPNDQVKPMFVDGQDDFEILPAEGLAEGVYTATLTVANVKADIAISMELVLNVYTAASLSGTITSYGNDSDILTIDLYKADDASCAYRDQPIGNVVSYLFEDMVPGEYVLEISKDGHKPHRETLFVSGDMVADVELMPTLPVSVIAIDLYGYELAKPMNDFGLYTNTAGVEIGGYVVTDVNNNVVNNSFAAADTAYWITVQLNPADGYHFNDLLFDECTLDGVKAVSSSVQYDGAWLTFPLPSLRAETITEIALYTENYAYDNDFRMLGVYSDTRGVHAADINVIDTQMSVLEGAFDYNTPYLFEVMFVAAGGCELAFDDMQWITLDGVSAMALYELGEGAYAAVFQMPALKVQHMIDFTVGDLSLGIQYVNDGESAIEPEEPYFEGFVFIGWYTEDGVPYDFSQPVTESMVLLGKFAEGHNVIFVFLGEPLFGYTVEHGKTATEPAEPAREGQIFLGWFTADGERYDFSTPVVSDLMLYATFEDAPSLLLGDMNFDGQLNTMDALLLFGCINGARVMTAEQETVADYTQDGSINMMDALRLFKTVSGG